MISKKDKEYQNQLLGFEACKLLKNLGYNEPSRYLFVVIKGIPNENVFQTKMLNELMAYNNCTRATKKEAVEWLKMRFDAEVAENEKDILNLLNKLIETNGK